MTLNEIFTDNFFANPKSADFVKQLESASEYFKADLPKGVNKKKYFTFVALMLDPSSELKKNITSLPQRKTLAALAAGFTLDSDNKFTPDIESVLVGANMDAARMQSEYAMLSMGMDFAAYTFYTRIFVELVAMSHQNAKKDTVLLIGKVRDETEKIERKIFGGDEVLQMKKALYLSSKSMSLNLQMEDIIDRIAQGDDLSEFNPYPDGYKPSKITYAGETVDD